MSRKKKQESGGAPEWMVTFGDLMSLLLTFFVLLFSVSEVKEQKIYEVIRSIRTFWNIDVPSAGFPIESFDEVLSMLAEQAMEIPGREQGKSGRSDDQVEQPFGDFVQVSQIEDRLQLNIEGKVLFEHGSAELRADGRKVVERIRERLVGFPNRIRIIGHTSPEPLGPTVPYDHYDLGFQRSKAVMAVLLGEGTENGGIRPERLEVTSHGRNNPLPGVNLFDPVDRARLRRVEIIVTPENALRGSST